MELSQFMDITGTEAEVANLYLTMCDNNVEQAMSLYFDDVTHDRVLRPQGDAAPARPPADNVNLGAEDNNRRADQYGRGSGPDDDDEDEDYRIAMELQRQQYNAAPADFDPNAVPDVDVPPMVAGRPVAQAVENPFEKFSHNRKENPFACPPYVARQFSSVDAECLKAAKLDRWVLLGLTDTDFPSVCMPRDFWRSAAVESLQNAGILVCYEVNVTSDLGRILAHEFGLTPEDTLPLVLLLNPVTTHCEFKLSCPYVGGSRQAFRALDTAAVVAAIMDFTTSHGTPAEYMNRLNSDPSTVVDVDASASSGAPTSVPPSAVASAHALPPPAAAASAFATEPSPAPAPAPPLEEPSIAEWSGSDLRLRVRLPGSTPLLSLSLRAETPVRAVQEYIADFLRFHNQDTYAARPTIAISAGFPPRSVLVPADDSTTTVSSWPGVKNSDTLTVRVE